jgi:acyl-coenzyme A thioesterase PaaI-like protein
MNVPADLRFAERCRASFGRQKAMALIGAALTVVESGYVETELPYRADLTQQKGFIHPRPRAGLAGRESPGREAGPHADHCAREVYADDGKHIASMQQTLMMLENTPDTPE